MNARLVSTLLLTTAVLLHVEAGNILIIHPFPSYSHQIPIHALTEELVRVGHNVTLVGTNPIPGSENKYNFVDLSFAYRYFSPDSQSDLKVDFQNTVSKWHAAERFAMFLGVIERQILNHNFQKFQRQVQDEKLSFDVVIIESFYVAYFKPIVDLIAGRTPVIAFFTMSSDHMTESALGSIVHHSFVPSFITHYSDRMSFWQRLENWYYNYIYSARVKRIGWEMAKNFLKEHYGTGTETLVDSVYEDISLLMLTSNSLYYYPRQLSPNIIELGPMHIKTPQKLPEEIQEWMDGAENGVIYVSLGTNVRSESLPNKTITNLIHIFRELPRGYRVLWKWGSPKGLPEQPENVLTLKWLPQQSVLAHEKTKVFLTQGGLQSFQEAVHYSVPTIVIPWFGDQRCNANKMIQMGVGYLLQPAELGDYDKVKAAVEAVLFKESYAQSMKKYSAISHDFTNKSVEKAVFWVEHILRHGPATHLRPSTADTTYFHFLCLDIVIPIVGVCALSLYMLGKVLKVLLFSSFGHEKIKIKTF